MLVVEQPRKENILFTSIESDNLRLVKSLVEKAAMSLDQVDEEGNTVLHRAVLMDRKRIAKYFLEKSEYLISVLNRDGLAPVHLALKSNNPGLLELLLWISADKSVKTRDGLGLIQFTVKETHHSVLKLLLRSIRNRKAQINAQNNAGETALHLAASFGCRETIKLLVKNGGNLRIRDRNGKLPFHHALCNGYFLTAEFIAKLDNLNLKEALLEKFLDGTVAMALALQNSFDPRMKHVLQDWLAAEWIKNINIL